MTEQIESRADRKKDEYIDMQIERETETQSARRAKKTCCGWWLTE